MQDRTKQGLIINVRLSCKFSKFFGTTAGATKGVARRKPANTVRSGGLGLQPQVGAAHERSGCVRNGCALFDGTVRAVASAARVCCVTRVTHDSVCSVRDATYLINVTGLRCVPAWMVFEPVAGRVIHDSADTATARHATAQCT